MRHLNSGRKLNRTKAHRRALFANLATSLVEHEQIKTTLPKAKDLRPLLEKYITLAKRGGLNSYRLLISRLCSQEAAKKLVEDIAPRCKDRQGGYLRITKAGFRYGDNAPMAIIEFVDRKIKVKNKTEGDKVSKDSKTEKSTEEASPKKSKKKETKKTSDKVLAS